MWNKICLYGINSLSMHWKKAWVYFYKNTRILRDNMYFSQDEICYCQSRKIFRYFDNKKKQFEKNSFSQNVLDFFPVWISVSYPIRVSTNYIEICVFASALAFRFWGKYMLYNIQKQKALHCITNDVFYSLK